MAARLHNELRLSSILTVHLDPEFPVRTSSSGESGLLPVFHYNSEYRYTTRMCTKAHLWHTIVFLHSPLTMNTIVKFSHDTISDDWWFLDCTDESAYKVEVQNHGGVQRTTCPWTQWRPSINFGRSQADEYSPVLISGDTVKNGECSSSGYWVYTSQRTSHGPLIKKWQQWLFFSWGRWKKLICPNRCWWAS